MFGLPPCLHYNTLVKPSPLVSQPAPPFALKAVATGRVFRLEDYRDRAVLLIFADHNTGRSAQAVVEHLRRRYPRFVQLAIALVIDARIVPRLFRGTAEGRMEKEFRETAATIPQGFDPAEHLILLPDWNGQITRAYHAADLGRHLHLVLIAPGGLVRAEYHGPEPAARAVELVQLLIGD